MTRLLVQHALISQLAALMQTPQASWPYRPLEQISERALTDATAECLRQHPTRTSIDIHRMWTATWSQCAHRELCYEASDHGDGIWPQKPDRVRMTYRGYPYFVKESAHTSPEGRIFRIYMETRGEMDSILGSGTLLASGYHYVYGSNPQFFREDYPDLTGIFITVPEQTNTREIGVSTATHYVDFRLPEEVRLISHHNMAFIIAGPMRRETSSWGISVEVLQGGDVKSLQKQSSPVVARASSRRPPSEPRSYGWR